MFDIKTDPKELAEKWFNDEKAEVLGVLRKQNGMRGAWVVTEIVMHLAYMSDNALAAFRSEVGSASNWYLLDNEQNVS